MKLHIKEDYEIESAAYNLDDEESRRKEIADRFGKKFIPDDHLLRCKDDKELNIQVGKKYKCTATNGQRVEIVSIDKIYDDNSATITAFYRGNMIAIGSTQLYESKLKEFGPEYSRTVANGDLYICPICGNEIFYDDVFGFYCDNCGEQIDGEPDANIEWE